MNKSESIKEIAGALAKAQAEIKPAQVDAQNPHFRSHYSTWTSVIEACKNPLSDNGLSFVQAITEGSSGSDSSRWYLETMLMHLSGEWISSSTPLIIDKNNMQGLGSAISYAKRYALAAMIGVVSDQDDDANSASDKDASKKPSKPKMPVKDSNHQSPPAVNQNQSSNLSEYGMALKALTEVVSASSWKNEQVSEYIQNVMGVKSAKNLSIPEIKSLIIIIKTKTPDVALGESNKSDSFANWTPGGSDDQVL